MGWIGNAIACDVEALTVSLFFRTEIQEEDDFPVTQIEFPSCVFSSGSLRYLAVNMRSAILKGPCFSSSSISNLVRLSLRNVTVEDEEGFCKWVSFSCRFLKKLLLECVNGLENIIIVSSSLEVFWVKCPSAFHLEVSGDKLEDVQIDWDSNRTDRIVLHISAPNLKHLKWVGHLMKNLYLGEFNCLDEVEISFFKSDGLGGFLSLHDYVSARDQFVCSIGSAKVLILTQWALETLFGEYFTHASFYNVWYLRICISRTIDDKLVRAMVFLFKGVPNLNTLDISSNIPSIEVGTNAFGFPKGYWELQGLDFISQLKEVTIELTNGSNGIRLAWYILEHAQNLKKMIVICFPNLPHHSGFMTKLKRTRILSNATVVIQEKKESKYF
ncbi:hypothetical protein M0R45_029855 [Rubus argutus]